MSHAAEVRRGYDRWAVVYDHDANPMPALEEPVVQAAAGDVAGLQVLDLGCGTGRHALWMSAAGAQVTAADFSTGMLEQASKKPGAETIRFITHDLHQPLPIEPAIDLVVSGLVLEHLADLRPFFAEVHRVLKSDGRAVISTMHPAMFQRGSQARFTDPETGELVQPGSFNHSISDCVMAALQAGLTLEAISEHAPDAEFAGRFPRSEKYVGWPMLVVFSFGRTFGISQNRTS